MTSNRLYTLLIFCLSTVSAQAAFYVPPSLSAGDTYQLVFVSSGTRDSTSSNIADYNAFVQSQASLNATFTGTNVGVQYTAISSTQLVDARANALVSTKVFNMNGEKIADDFTDMWDGTLDNPILYDQFANLASLPDMWTGSNSAGFYATGLGLGEATPRTGLAITASSNWIDDGVIGNSTSLAFYGLSQVLTVSSAVPVPAAAYLFGSALLGLAGIKRKNNSNKLKY